MEPYRKYSTYIKEIFGFPVYKVAVDGGFSCPNRDGTKGTGGCAFCDETGASSRTRQCGDTIGDQLRRNIIARQSRGQGHKFIAYLQSYTNTYATCDILKDRYDQALSAHEDIIGLSVSTRPDTIDEEKLQLLASYKKQIPYVSIEYGMQTIHDKTLARINRGETHEDFLKALELTKQYDIDHCIHVIIGLPGESREDILATAKKLAALQVNGVKIHCLVAMEKTPLETMYNTGKWTPLSYDEHITIIADFIEHLHKECIIHRISGNGHPRHIVAPQWMKDKKGPIVSQAIIREFERRGTYQGIHCR
ncbi:MAG: TIGR01212 family radical SAM protein [Waddliaceae bacterium]|nr:TIGR01212 family radical SAM protein [Waddliaceae bacterium]